ncbi:hypothetical protein Tco_0162620 [Tanacetum coccineum]
MWNLLYALAFDSNSCLLFLFAVCNLGVRVTLSRGSFDVLVGMDRLSKRKFGIVCHGKVVRIPLEGDEILQVHGERTQGVVKTLMNTKKRSMEFILKLELDLLRMEKLYAKRITCLGQILATSSEMSKVKDAPAEMLRDLDQQMEKRADDGCTLWIKLYSKYGYEIRYHLGKANVVIEALIRKERVKPRRVRAMAMTIHKEWNSGDDQLRLRWMIYLVVLADAAESVRDTIGFEYCLASSSGWTKSPVLWAEIGESSLTGPELVLDTTDKVVLIKEKLKAARDRQKSYADKRRKPLEFEILERIGPVAYRLRLPEELSSVHDTFHVSNLKKCLADANLHVPLNEIKIDKTLRFVEELVEIMDREIRNLKRSKIPLVKVHWNSKRGPEFTWEREDHMKSKYPQLFVDRAVESAS